MRVTIWVLLAMAAGWSISATTWAAPSGTSPFQTIALTGDPAPGTSGRQFLQFNPPDINDLGRIAFIAQLNCCSPLGTVYSTGRGALELVAFQGQPVESGSARNFASFGDVQIDNLGRTLITGAMHEVADFSATWIGQENGQLTRIVMSGQPVDPSVPETTYRLASPSNLSGTGLMAGVGVTITGGRISPDSDVLFRSDGTHLAQPALRAGDRLHFFPPGVTLGIYDDPAFDRPVINDQGQIAVRVASVIADGRMFERYDSHLLLIEPDGSYQEVGPGHYASMPVLSDAGDVAFGAEPFAQTIFRRRYGQSVEVVAQRNDPAPGIPGARFDSLFVNLDSEMPLWINERGDTAFWSTLVGGPFTTHFAESVWIGSPGNLRSVIVEGTPAPGTGGNFSSMESTIGDMILSMAVNNNSQVAALAYFDSSNGDRRAGLFATDLAGNLQKIVAYGDQLEVAPGVFRIVESISFEGDAFQRDGSGLNDRGEIAFSAYFRDGTSGVFISSLVAVPEPSAMLLLLTAQLAWICSRSRGTVRQG